MFTRKAVLRILLPLILCVASPHAQVIADSALPSGGVAAAGEREVAYAVVMRQSTYDDPAWQPVADALLTRYGGELFLWNSYLGEVQSDVASFEPTHIGFVCDMATASASFVQSHVWNFTRALDGDTYCDAIWGIITGYTAEDALNLVTEPYGFDVKTVLGGTSSCDLAYYTQGICTNEATYGRYYVKHSDSEETTTFDDGPTDRTEWLVTMLNEGIDIFDYDPVDIFYTSGHGNHNMWQMHYPDAGLEGYFRSYNGQVYGDPHSGADIDINAPPPRIYFGLGNCYIGKILGGSSMAPSWIHTGGAYQYTGYVIAEGSSSHQHGGTKSYFYRVARCYTWAEAYYLANQALRFDILNHTPGANPPDLNGSALYGDPGFQARMSHEGIFREPLFETSLTVDHGAAADTVTFRITMNREGRPGFTSKWGERHPAVILPFRAHDTELLYTDAMETVIADDFALMYIWHQGQPDLPEGATREMVFTCTPPAASVDGDPLPERDVARLTLYCNQPNPANSATRISYALPEAGSVRLCVYDVAGQLVDTVVDESQPAGSYSVSWNTTELSPGIYFGRITVGDLCATRKIVVMK